MTVPTKVEFSPKNKPPTNFMTKRLLKDAKFLHSRADRCARSLRFFRLKRKFLNGSAKKSKAIFSVFLIKL